MKWVMGFLLVLFLLSCSSVQHVEPTGYSAENFWADQNERRKVVQKVSANLSLNYSGMGEGAGKAQMIAEMPNHFRMEVRDPLGRVHLISTLEGTNFAVVYPRVKRFHKDSQAGKTFLKKIVGFDYSFNFLLPLMFGILPADMAKTGFHAPWQWDLKVGRYRGEIKVKGTPWLVWVNPQNSAIEKIEIQAASPFTIEYLDFFRCCGGSVVGAKNSHFQLAQSMTLQNQKAKTSLDVRWREVETKTAGWPPQAFQASVPKGMAPLE